ncbi:SDR family NAD(P)-dependent oxidoreductase [Streptomyces thermoviolaceus]|uniref:SDR family NAD(P)-dependent oxidoreductase n=1 Tax=Streptomyces thermoviolaceus TaxID=1952 RepID=UPI00199CC031|nr:SDR family NAD(P)-dependent oxidoreductase [Streptomyces thermoviolaceus]GGV77097.1 hypothetical protein GCM10010499_35750 [Streptomyces thermoviolaceus subsp. apingens]
MPPDRTQRGGAVRRHEPAPPLGGGRHIHLSAETGIVTGASRGIGLATVTALTAEGARVAGISRTVTPEVHETGAVAVTTDLGVPHEATAAVRSAVGSICSPTRPPTSPSPTSSPTAARRRRCSAPGKHRGR